MNLLTVITGRQLSCSGDVLLVKATASVNLRNYGEFNDKIKSFKCELYSS